MIETKKANEWVIESNIDNDNEEITSLLRLQFGQLVVGP